MAGKETNVDLQEIFKASLEEAKEKARSSSKKREEEEEEEEESSPKKKAPKGKKKEEEEEEEESSPKKKFKKKMEEETEVSEETLSAATLKTHKTADAVNTDPKSKISMIQSVVGVMSGMGKGDLTKWFNDTMAQFGPGKEYGVGDNSEKNKSTLNMKPSNASASMKEDIDEMFSGEELTEEFKEKVSTLFEAAVGARVMTELVRLEEAYADTLAEEIVAFSEETNIKIDNYLTFVAESWLTDNEVAIESSLRNGLMEEFMEGLKTLFADHYIDVPNEKINALESLTKKVNVLENKLDETITENVELKSYLLDGQRKEIFENLASDLALTQQEKFSALAEGIEFSGDLTSYEKKLMIIKENYFKSESTTYNTNINEETFDVEEERTTRVDPQVNRYVEAIARSVKK
jgi:hypothetical protein